MTATFWWTSIMDVVRLSSSSHWADRIKSIPDLMARQQARFRKQNSAPTQTLILQPLHSALIKSVFVTVAICSWPCNLFAIVFQTRSLRLAASSRPLWHPRRPTQNQQSWCWRFLMFFGSVGTANKYQNLRGIHIKYNARSTTTWLAWWRKSSRCGRLSKPSSGTNTMLDWHVSISDDLDTTTILRQKPWFYECLATYTKYFLQEL